MKRKSICLIISLIMLMLSACSFADFPLGMETLEKEPELLIEPIPEEMVAEELPDETTEKGSDEILTEPVVDMQGELGSQETESDEPAQADDGLAEKGEGAIVTNANTFYYSRLSDGDKQIYEKILTALLERSKATFPAETLDSLGRIFNCVMNDHPEIFYVYGYTCTKEFLGDELQRVYLEGTMNMEPEEVEQRKKAIEQRTKAILANLDDVTDSYEIAKYLYQYIIDHTDYDLHAVDNQNICSVLLNGSSVCQGYSKTFQYLLQQKGIQAALVQGTVTDGSNHAWNMVQLDGEYYYVDVTWGDASYSQANANQVIKEEKISINYDYMCVTTAEICRTHQLDPIVTLPICTAEKDNYYRREGFFFSGVDDAALQETFAREYEKGSSSITLKCASESVYRDMCNYLLEEQKIFTYLQGDGGSVSYANNDAVWTISFWL